MYSHVFNLILEFVSITSLFKKKKKKRVFKCTVCGQTTQYSQVIIGKREGRVCAGGPIGFKISIYF